MTQKTQKINSQKRYSRWFRFYTEARHNPKIVCLSDRQFRAWVNILTVAADSPNGVLPPMQHVACELRCTPNEAEKIVGELIDIGLVDIIRRHDDGPLLTPHNWGSRQYMWDCDDPTAAERSKRYRNRKKTEASRSRHGRVTVSASESVSVSASVSPRTTVNSSQEVSSSRGYARNGYALARDGDDWNGGAA